MRPGTSYVAAAALLHDHEGSVKREAEEHSRQRLTGFSAEVVVEKEVVVAVEVGLHLTEAE